jgi:VIT1/CCC1 family predicted Fe2+/Mn2+ transporter
LSAGFAHRLTADVRGPRFDPRNTWAVRHSERHRTDRIGWLRAAVLGANDGIVSTASLVLGVAAAIASDARLNVVVAGSSLAFLAILDSLAARVGGARMSVGAVRVTFWGALEMALTAGVGAMFGIAA